MAEALEISKRTADRIIYHLKKANILERIGGDKQGIWRILEKD